MELGPFEGSAGVAGGVEGLDRYSYQRCNAERCRRQCARKYSMS